MFYVSDRREIGLNGKKKIYEYCVIDTTDDSELWVTKEELQKSIKNYKLKVYGVDEDKIKKMSKRMISNKINSDYAPHIQTKYDNNTDLITLIKCDLQEEEIYIPEGIEALKDGLFRSRTYKKITMSDDLISIGDECFYRSRIDEIVFSKNLKCMGSKSFCSSSFIKLDFSQTKIDSIPYTFCAHNNNLVSVYLPDTVTKLGSEGFSNCKSLTDFRFTGKHLIQVGSDCFSNTGISNLNFLTGLEDKTKLIKLSSGCFKYLENLISADLTYCILDRYTRNLFDSCRNLISVTLGENTLEIPGGMFRNCESLQTLNYPLNRQLKMDCGDVFLCSGITKFVGSFPSTDYMGGAEFMKSNIESVELFDVKKLPSEMFSGCERLKQVIIHYDGNLTIDSECFLNCVSLVDVQFINKSTNTEHIVNVFRKAFKGCTSLANFDFVKDFTSLDTEVFEDCKAMTVVELNERIDTINEGLFRGCTSLTTVVGVDNIPPTDIDLSAFFGTKVVFTNQELNNKLRDFKILQVQQVLVGNNLVLKSNGNKTTAVELRGKQEKLDIPKGVNVVDLSVRVRDIAESIREVSIPDTVNSILKFPSCCNLTKVTVPSTMRNIPSELYGGLITHITLPKVFTHIKDGEFRGLYSLRIVEFEGEITSIGEYAFANTGLIYFKVPEGCTTLGQACFKGCRYLKTVILPSTITKIPGYAFQDCFELKTVIMSDKIEKYPARAFPYGTKIVKINYDLIKEMTNTDGTSEKFRPTFI